MEVPTSKNRMSAHTFLTLFFSKKMSTLDSFDGLANKDFSITYYIISGFVLLTTNIQQFFGNAAEVIGRIYLATTHVFGTFYQWYALWTEIKQLHLIGQRHTNGDTDCQWPQML